MVQGGSEKQILNCTGPESECGYHGPTCLAYLSLAFTYRTLVRTFLHIEAFELQCVLLVYLLVCFVSCQGILASSTRSVPRGLFAGIYPYL